MEAPTGLAAPASGTDIPTFEELAADPEIAPLLDFEPVPRKVKRPDGWTPELQRELIARIALTGTLQRAVWQMGKHATGAEGLYKTPCADSFRAAWDAAIALGRRRNGLDSAPPWAGDVPGIHRRRPRGQPAAADNDAEWEDDETEIERRAEDAADSIRIKLLRCRRMFLEEISGSPGKRAAFEILTELPIDWAKAAAGEPQPDEPYNSANQREPDMILTAESGWSFGELDYGPDKKAELRRAIDEHRAAEGLPAVDWNGSDDDDGEGEDEE
jgi:hypothetical protein